MNWMGEVLDANSESLITVNQGIEVLESMQQQLTEEQIYKIKEVCVRPSLPDKLIFTPSRDGRFNTKAYLSQVLAVRPYQTWTNTVWNPFTTARVNAFMWRLYQRALPVDDNIQAKGIILASKCTCCMEAKRETLTHLFLESDLAKEVWLHFSRKLSKPYHASSIDQLIRGWLAGVSRRSQLGYVTLAIMFYGLWEIWKERCSMTYDDTKRSRAQVIHAVYEHVYAMNLMQMPKRKPSHWEVNILEMLRVPVKQVATKKGRWIAWSKPDSGMIKVNSDGSKRGNHTSGGGVFF